jgi:hypothetical protein
VMIALWIMGCIDTSLKFYVLCLWVLTVLLSREQVLWQWPKLWFLGPCKQEMKILVLIRRERGASRQRPDPVLHLRPRPTSQALRLMLEVGALAEKKSHTQCRTFVECAGPTAPGVRRMEVPTAASKVMATSMSRGYVQ